MHPNFDFATRARRDFLTSTASGLGLAAIGSMLTQDGVLGNQSASAAEAVKQAVISRMPHFAPQAKNCIFLLQAGAPSHLDLYSPKPKLNELDGQPLPKEMLEKVRFAFIKKDSAVLLRGLRSSGRVRSSTRTIKSLRLKVSRASSSTCI